MTTPMPMLIITNFHLYLIQLWWQFFQNFVLWRRSLCSNLGGIGPEKRYQNSVKELKSAASFSGSYWKTDHLYLNQFMVIQRLPLISCLANMAGDRPLLV